MRVPQVSQDKRFAAKLWMTLSHGKEGKLQKHFGFGSGCGGALAAAAAGRRGGGGGGSGERDMFAAIGLNFTYWHRDTCDHSNRYFDRLVWTEDMCGCQCDSSFNYWYFLHSHKTKNPLNIEVLR